MRRTRIIYTALILSAVLLAALFCGCVGKPENTDAPSTVTPTVVTPTPDATVAPESPKPTETAQPAPDPLSALPEDVQALADASKSLIVVHSTEELVAAIAPNTAILVEPGYYNMSEYLQEMWAQSDAGWDPVQLHRYAYLEPGFDGAGLVIQSVDNLSIFGRGASAETELVIEPRYADVFAFKDCERVSLARLTLGHTETGECFGSVVGFYDCRDVSLSEMDLYGCGVYGVNAEDTYDLRVQNSTIRDCSYGPLCLYDAYGQVSFTDCVLDGSDGGFLFIGCDAADISFVRCTFGEMESNSLTFLDDVVTEDCIWHEITQYPDIEPGLDGELVPVRFDALVLADTAWLGESMYNFATQEETMLPLRREGCNIDVILRLSADGTGQLVGLEDDPLPLRWEMADDSDYYANIYMQGEYAEDGKIEIYAGAFVEESPLWMEFWLGDISIRFTDWNDE